MSITRAIRDDADEREAYDEAFARFCEREDISPDHPTSRALFDDYLDWIADTAY